MIYLEQPEKKKIAKMAQRIASGEALTLTNALDELGLSSAYSGDVLREFSKRRRFGDAMGRIRHHDDVFYADLEKTKSLLVGEKRDIYFVDGRRCVNKIVKYFKSMKEAKEAMNQGFHVERSQNGIAYPLKN